MRRMEVRHNGRSEAYVTDKAFMDWLKGITKESYQIYCRDAFIVFLQYLRDVEGWKEPTGDLVIQQHYDNRKSDDKPTKYYFDNLLPMFVDWLEKEYNNPRTKQKSMNHNSAVSLSGAVRGFFRFHREELKVQRGKIQYEEKAKGYHTFKQKELAEMVRVANVQEKAIILLGKDEGIRVGDFVAQKRHRILEAYKDSEGQFPLEFEVETEKRGVVAVAHILEETWLALQDYWKSAPESRYIFPSNEGYISEDTANRALKETWLRIFPDRTKTTVRFHELRSFKMTALSNVGINKWHIQRMVGKKLSTDILTYLQGINLKTDFMKAEDGMRLTRLSSGTNHETFAELQKQMRILERKNKILLERLEKSENVELQNVARELRMLEYENLTMGGK
jgi:hypothetical protein